MASENPTFHQPDYMELTKREIDAASLSSGWVPEFEAGVILATVKAQPGMTKRELVRRVLGRMGRPLSEERVFLRHIDCLVRLGQLVRHNFYFHLTPDGTQRLRQIRESLASAMNLIYTNG
jgi:hypothetical protein